MEWWTPSLPDYEWPAPLRSIARAPMRWALAALFHAARLAGLLAGTLRPLPAAVLVIRTDGIGDGVLFEPALRSLAERFAGGQLHLWAPAAMCELFADHSAVSAMLCVPRGGKAGNLDYFGSAGWRATMGWRLGRYRFDSAIYAVQSPEPMGNWLLVAARTRQRWYAPGDTQNQRPRQRDATASRVTTILNIDRGGHELARNAEMAGQWGAEVNGLPNVEIGADALREARDVARMWRERAAAAGAVAIAGVMPGGSASMNAYPGRSWASVIRTLWTRHRAMCVLFGGEADAARVAEIVSGLADVPYVRAQGLTSLRVTAALLRHVEVLLTVDTGLAHLAAAQAVRSVVLRNGGHPGRFFPWPGRTSSIVLSRAMPCEGCLCRCVLKEAECVTMIPPEQVVEAYARHVQAAAAA